MNPATGSRQSEVRNFRSETADQEPEAGIQKAIALPLGFILAFCGLILVPPVWGNATLVWTFAGVGAGLLLWLAILLFNSKRAPRLLKIEFVPVKSHYVQASVQFCVYAYWGWYWRKVYAEAPLILAQVLFLYVFDALLSWSRGRNWRLGFGPLPIIFSTNLFMWFKDDWFIFQFLMVATGALGKEFIKWKRDGKRTHVFNPSAFGLGLVSVVLIFTGTTHLTWGEEVATTLAMPPHIYLQIFLVGLIVQYFFSVTLMTLSAAAMLCLLNLVYTRMTGVYQFVDSNIPIAVFLGLHLLVTDPSTSPRTNLGRIIFGALYGVGNSVLYSWLSHFGAPEFYDKLLPVPLLNLSVRIIDRLARGRMLGSFDRWESRFQGPGLNLAHMGCWIALFTAMLTTGFVERPHEGGSVAFWKKALAEGRPHASESLVRLLNYRAKNNSGPACNELGVLYMEGKLVPRDSEAAASLFARACELGDTGGCANLAIQYLFQGAAKSPEDAARALQRLEEESVKGTNGRNCYLAGYAYETGRGRPPDKQRANDLYLLGATRGDLESCKSLARIKLSGEGGPIDLKTAVMGLEQACAGGDAESCLYLAYLYHGGTGVPRDEKRGRALLEQACRLGSAQACQALKQIEK